MEKNELEKYLNRLKELDKELSEEEDADPTAFMNELNTILNGLSHDVQKEIKTKNLSPTLKFVNKSSNPDPTFAHEGDSGFDIRAHLTDVKIIHLSPKAYCVISTGLYFEVEKGLEIQIRPRSGNAYNYGITIVNTPGTIDSHYRGEVKIILANLGNEDFTIKNGDRIAQGVVCPVYGEGNLNLTKVEKLSDTRRGESGFGSTGRD